MESTVTDWRRDPELVQVQTRLALERAKHEEASSRIPSASDRVSEVEQQLADCEALASVGRKSTVEVEAALRGVEAARENLRHHRGAAAVALETAGRLEQGMLTIEGDAIRRADEFLRSRTAELVAELDGLLPAVAKLNEELDSLWATARHTTPANGADSAEVKRAGVAISCGFQHSLAFMRPPTSKTIQAWREMVTSALEHSTRIASRCRQQAEVA